MHVVMFSGGAASWAAAKMVAERHGTEDMVLLFADTRMEDPDLYRWLPEAAANVGAKLEVIQEGRTVWEVFRDKRLIGNTRMDPCSEMLKRKPLRRWLEARCNPTRTTVYLGMGFGEEERVHGAAHHWEPYKVVAPLLDVSVGGWRTDGGMDKDAMLEWVRAEGMEPPWLYELGFATNNCGGACVKAGQGQWARLLATRPEVYEHWEAEELAWQEAIGKPHTILRDRRGGTTKPMTLRTFRERLLAGDVQGLSLEDFHGCGGACMTPPDEPAVPP